MKTALVSLLLTLAACLPSLCYSQSVDDAFDMRLALPGQFEIEGASARPAAKAYYLLYAAALDQYMSKKAELLSKEPVLDHLLKRQFSDNYGVFTHYESIFGKYSPVKDANHEATELEWFLKNGYDGKLRKEIETYIAKLREGEKIER